MLTETGYKNDWNAFASFVLEEWNYYGAGNMYNIEIAFCCTRTPDFSGYEERTIFLSLCACVWKSINCNLIIYPRCMDLCCCCYRCRYFTQKQHVLSRLFARATNWWFESLESDQMFNINWLLSIRECKLFLSTQSAIRFVCMSVNKILNTL